MAARRAAGEGYVRQRASGRWEAVLTLPATEPGKQRRRSFYAPTRKGALEKLAQARAELLLHQREPLDTRGSVAQLLDWWLADLVAPRLRATSLRTFRSHVTVHLIPRLGTVRLHRLGAPQIQSVITAMLADHARVTVRNVMRTLDLALRAGVRARLLTTNPMAGVVIPRADPPARRHLTISQARAFLEAARGDEHEVLVTAENFR